LGHMSPDVAQSIEEHALLSDQRTTALVTREGEVDWLCMPRFDSPALLCSLLGEPEHGRWSIRIEDGRVLSRRYLPGTMILETRWQSPTGTATVTDFMPIPDEDPHVHPAMRSDQVDHSDLVRSVRCTSGEVAVLSELRIRFD